MNSANQLIDQTRKARTKVACIASLLLAAAALPILMPVQKAQADNRDSERDRNSEPLLGTWLLETTLDPNSVPPGTTLVFTVIPTFGAGGGIVQGETGNGPSGVNGGPDAHGNWAKTGHRTYVATTRAPNYDDAHHFTGERKVKDVFIVNPQGDELVGSFRLDLSLADGTVLPFHPTGTYHGLRMPIEPLN